MLEHKATTTAQQKGMMKVMGLDYIIHYKKEKKNQTADALSRWGFEEEKVQAIIVVVPTWSLEIANNYEWNHQIQQIVAEVFIKSESQAEYTYKQGVLKFKGRIYIGKTRELRQKLLELMHALALGGHLGMNHTYKRIEQLFY